MPELGTAIYGLMAEFQHPDDLLEAIRRTREEGYRELEAYSPQPFAGLSDAMGFRESPIPLIVLTGAAFGAMLAFFIMYYSSAIDYPLNIGGRPLNSWVSFLPLTFQMAILFGVCWALFFGVWAMNGLPRPYHPVFNVPAFARAGHDRYFLCIEAADERFDRELTRRFLERLGPLEVHVVEN